MRIIVCFLFAFPLFFGSAQNNLATTDSSWKSIYRGSEPKINDLVNTKLEVSFDFDKCYLYGKAWITLTPHFYPTDTVNLDAKGMNINEVSIYNGEIKKPLQYIYQDSSLLRIKLDKTYLNNQKYTIYISYVSKPNERKTQGSAAITDDKGLYFINPKGEIKDKPTQVWTQGETQSNSVWFPTIDYPDQKSTEQIAMTVPDKYVTLSNGLKISSKKNANSTRTDTWRMDLPHAPYLFFMGVGDFSIIKDTYKGKPVNYYVEPAYASVARKIFGHTPEMMAYFSKLLNFEYVWPKYDQMVGRDYVSGAMENTTATLHQSSAQQNARQLVDGNEWEDVIAHELFHHWFGDLVTAESWSNITLNESFADFSEQLWESYKYGKDAGDAQAYNAMQDYFQSQSDNKDLVRFYYKDREDLFDAVSYNKGGRILNMLKHYVGDAAFFQSLHLYLTQNKFGTAEAGQLRLAFEQVTGKDMNWFWNQWYYGSGHPILDIQYHYDEGKKTSSITIEQQQQNEQLFKLPIDIDIYTGNKKIRHSVWMDQKKQTFSFPQAVKPALINVDGDKILLVQKTDHKDLQEFIAQYKLAGNYVDRKESIDFALDHQNDPVAKSFLMEALKDPFKGIRIDILQAVDPNSYSTPELNIIESLAKNDPQRLVRASAIDVLGILKSKQYEPLFIDGTNDSSYSVAGASLEALMAIDRDKAMSLVPELSKDAKGRLKLIIDKVSLFTKSDADFDQIYDDFTSIHDAQTKAMKAIDMTNYLANLHNTSHIKKLTDAIIIQRNKVGESYPEYKNIINTILKAVITKKQTELSKVKDKAEQLSQINYLQQQLN